MLFMFIFTQKKVNMIRKITALLVQQALFWKVMESLIKETLLEFLQNANALSDSQFGFIPGG